MREAIAERDRIRRDAMLDAKAIRDDAAEEAAKLLSKLNTEREHILADARDDARRIFEAAHATAWVDEGSDPSQHLNEQARDSEGDESSDDSRVRAVESPSADDVWLVRLDSIFDDTDPPPTPPPTATWKTRRRRWYQRRR